MSIRITLFMIFIFSPAIWPVCIVKSYHGLENVLGMENFIWKLHAIMIKYTDFCYHE